MASLIVEGAKVWTISNDLSGKREFQPNSTKSGTEALGYVFTWCDNSYTMNTRKPPESMTDILRRRIIESRVSYKSLSQETGVARASIQRFVDGRQSLRLDLADRLAAYFGIVAVSKPRLKSRKSDL